VDRGRSGLQSRSGSASLYGSPAGVQVSAMSIKPAGGVSGLAPSRPPCLRRRGVLCLVLVVVEQNRCINRMV